ncbi:hypothetical protein GGR51DRAFT_513038 [Nemania sp. FL0031]|nr:hypothetical protein GGR51DRAFT_513038 [Nemania sp. FL0031]
MDVNANLKKKIIVCCDGTAHSAIKGNDFNPYTNVLRFSRCIKSEDQKKCPQIVGYISGIGTSDGNPINRYLQGTGIGIDEKIKEAYSFICNNYNTEDEIFLIGFSRGAFVARCVADLVGKFGILTKMGIHYLPNIYDLWQRNDSNKIEGPVEAPSFATPEPFPQSDMNRDEFKKKLQSFIASDDYVRKNVHIKVCAVWDTVASLGGISTNLRVFRRWKSRKLNFVDSNLCHSIDFAIQALSLNEHRSPFLPIVWKLPDGEEEEKKDGMFRLQQCWFMGYHSDVGGGRRGEGLAHFPLAWMMSKLEAFLDFDRDNFWNPRPTGIDGAENDPARLRDSMSKRYWLAGSCYRRPKQQFFTPHPQTYDSDQIKSNETRHFSVNILGSYIMGPRMNPNQYSHIDDDEIDDLEAKLLMQWIKGERRLFRGEREQASVMSGLTVVQAKLVLRELKKPGAEAVLQNLEF